MELFISWSGALSFGVAVTLQKWFKEVIQAVDPFVSSETDKGTKWFTEIQKKLGHSSIGIICLSRENLHSDWILFEAGALAKQMKKSRVCPLLIDLSPSEVGAPLSQFQATTLTKSDLKRLVTSVNKSLPSKAQLQESFLDAQFEKCWPDFEKFYLPRLAWLVSVAREMQSLCLKALCTSTRL